MSSAPVLSQLSSGIPVPDLDDLIYSSDSQNQSPNMPIGFSSPKSSGPCQLIQPKELVEIINDPSSHKFEQILICDARFYYEFKGGHIVGAINIRSRSQLIGIYEHYLKQNICIVFHCEFSQDRGPTLYQQFRDYDRYHNIYPNLSYPNVFLLDGGYKRFYQEMPEYCTGGYIEMRDKQFVSNGELKKCHKFFEREMGSQKNPKPKRSIQRCRSQTITHFTLYDSSLSPPSFASLSFNQLPMSASQGSF